MRTFPLGLSYLMSPGRGESPGVTSDLLAVARSASSARWAPFVERALHCGSYFDEKPTARPAEDRSISKRCGASRKPQCVFRAGRSQGGPIAADASLGLFHRRRGHRSGRFVRRQWRLAGAPVRDAPKADVR
jgi:hypothetical protein